jgi:catechol 2,3-dioxygenase-like lactoylglutathione lyase family enzyme
MGLDMRVHHIALRTRDLDKLEKFYAGVLGLAVTQRHGTRSVWLDAAGTVMMLEHAEEDEPSIAEGSLELVAFATDEMARANIERLLGEASVPIEARTEHTLYFRDPDGRRVAVSTYAF